MKWAAAASVEVKSGRTRLGVASLQCKEDWLYCTIEAGHDSLICSTTLVVECAIGLSMLWCGPGAISWSTFIRIYLRFDFLSMGIILPTHGEFDIPSHMSVPCGDRCSDGDQG